MRIPRTMAKDALSMKKAYEEYLKNGLKYEQKNTIGPAAGKRKRHRRAADKRREKHTLFHRVYRGQRADFAV